jgi:type II secretory pathway component PulF
MNALPSNLTVESWWRTYLKAAAFLLPPVAIWAISCVFVFPKLKTLWRDTGFMDETMQGFMGASQFFEEHGLLIGAAFIALLGLLEWRKGLWPRYRRASVGTLVFLLNGAVLILIFAMLCSAVIVAASSLPRK